MYISYKFRIYPNKEQAKKIEKITSAVRLVYNYYLFKQKKLFENKQSFLSIQQCLNHLNKTLLKEEKYIWLNEIGKTALSYAIYNLEKACNKFLKNKEKGFPKFKAKETSKKTYVINNDILLNIQQQKIKLPELEWVKCIITRKIEGEIKSATIIKTTSDKYYISILATRKPMIKPKANKIIGIDLGLNDLVVDSNNNKIENLRILYKYETKLKKEQRKLQKKQLGSQNRIKQRKKVAKTYERIKNIREAYLHQISTKIINENQIIITEKLKIKEMSQMENMGKAVSDASWQILTTQLSYKANWYGRIYHQINTWYPSSQLCSKCGYKNLKLKDLSIRKWTCPKCFCEHDRDINAALNIKEQGKKELKINKKIG